MKNPYEIILSRHVTEKSVVLGELESSESNPCTKRCETPKAVFLVHKNANKREIAQAIEEIYRERKVRVTKVNTITVPRKKRRVRGRSGVTSVGHKKAVVSLERGASLTEV